MKYSFTAKLTSESQGIEIPYDFIAEYSFFEGAVKVHCITCNAVDPDPLELLLAFELNQCSVTELENEIHENNHE